VGKVLRCEFCLLLHQNASLHPHFLFLLCCANGFHQWHVGDGLWEHLPTFRGFQTFLGYYGNIGDHFKHEDKSKVGPTAYDLHWHGREFCDEDCDEPFDARGKYSTYVLSARAKSVIESHAENTTDPLFLYLPYVAAHGPMQAPSWAKESYRDKPWTTKRKTYAGMLTALDKSVGNVFTTLKDTGMWKDTLVILMSDNGGPQQAKNQNRGGKMSLYDGGIKVDAILGGGALEKIGYQTGRINRMFHVTDWLPTIAKLIGVEPEGKPLHGIDQTDALISNKKQRDQFFAGYNMKVQVR